MGGKKKKTGNKKKKPAQKPAAERGAEPEPEADSTLDEARLTGLAARVQRQEKLEAQKMLEEAGAEPAEGNPALNGVDLPGNRAAINAAIAKATDGKPPTALMGVDIRSGGTNMENLLGLDGGAPSGKLS